ncbi:repetitive organellar protein-like [Liolophura sinensis]|uniref:repetitive organellar protein-like n=1 Tax=Liolophura sinensis TaxID=3198878 RepID=UPI00315924C7
MKESPTMSIAVAHRESVDMFTFPAELKRVPGVEFGRKTREDTWAENVRPRSTPSSAVKPRVSSSKMRRPKTAHPNMYRTECDRLYQVEHEPTRKQRMENHLPLKRNKPPPWQKNLDGPMTPCVVTPTYVLSRNKAKYNMTIKTEEFFDGHTEGEKQRPRFYDPEKDALIGELQQQINDLSLYLEEERMNHRQTRFKANQALKDKAEELEKKHQEEMEKLEEEHEKELQEQHAQHVKEFGKYKMAAEGQINRMKNETEFLQGAFDSYKGTLNQEMDQRWKRKEEEFRLEHEEIKQEALHDLKTKLITERNNERITMQKDHQKHVESVRKEYKKELNALQKRFSNAAADLERLKNVQTELEELKIEHESLQTLYRETAMKLKQTSTELMDTKVRLLTFEEQFDEKVAQVDDKYKQMMHDLMSRNTELRRLYVKKCGQLFDEKALTEQKRLEGLQTAKDTMQTLTEIRHRSKISLVGGLPQAPETIAAASSQEKPTLSREQQQHHQHRHRQTRPCSAPMTRQETKSAERNAGTLEEIQPGEEPPIRPQSSIPPSRPDVEEMRRQLYELKNMPLSDKLFEALQ